MTSRRSTHEELFAQDHSHDVVLHTKNCSPRITLISILLQIRRSTHEELSAQDHSHLDPVTNILLALRTTGDAIFFTKRYLPTCLYLPRALLLYFFVKLLAYHLLFCIVVPDVAYYFAP